MLTQGRRDAPARQRTLRAALDWSHALLSEVEVVVFRRLAVFAGSFSLEAARRLAEDAGGEPIDGWAVLDALGTLVDRSLVSADLGEPPRYHLLESARAFAVERLVESSEEVTIRQRHALEVARHFGQVTVESLCGDRGVDESVALLNPDLDNARAALAWFLRQGDAWARSRWRPR